MINVNTTGQGFQLPFRSCWKEFVRYTPCTAIGVAHAAGMGVYVVKADNMIGMPTHDINGNASRARALASGCQTCLLVHALSCHEGAPDLAVTHLR